MNLMESLDFGDFKVSMKSTSVPNTIASAHSRSASAARGSSALRSVNAFQAGLPAMAASGAVSATRRTRTSAPAPVAPSATACAVAWLVPVDE